MSAEQMINYKRPESVLVLVYTAASEVLLLRRVRPAAFWQSVTGSMEWSETEPRLTARRELFEETGIEVALSDIVDCYTTNQFPIKPAWRHRYAPNVKQNTEYVFRLVLPARRPITLCADEHSECLWLPRLAAADKATSYTNRDAILRFVPALSDASN